MDIEEEKKEEDPKLTQTKMDQEPFKKRKFEIKKVKAKFTKPAYLIYKKYNEVLHDKDDITEDEEFKQEQLKELGKKTNDTSESYGIFAFFSKSSERKRDETEALTVKRALFD